ncbi:putative bifunctional diguanylate cyclase/phosphodiesterase [Gluconacetobacter sacchari]|uniref:EAL domain-containing protein n=2 Tax=Gluconacetobacter sacchari TaxID=92759 RepID=A0A7W4IAV5_9PROT|nr:EAL domain-containing protein [Gluconacetobacter sacchari]MBB2159422.1 EAL domain-containing protein [Gluconacetobacter sacchari]GBQ27574.1 diguanylate cyclase [Gluconacetobacter sacchari DSM 12717]
MVSLPYRETEDFIRYALDNAAIVATTDVQGTITFVNEKFSQISGYERNELIGFNHRILRSGVHDAHFFRAMYRKISRGEIWQGEICNRRKDGSLYWVDTTIVPHVSIAGKVDGYTAIRFDITARKRIEDELRASRAHHRAIANHDFLTNLPNRRRLRHYIDDLAARDGRAGRGFHLAVLDIDAFKEINDSFGHDSGDLLLQTVACRLQSFVADGVFIGRLGGDEFGIVLDGVSDDAAQAFHETILESIREPIRIGAVTRHCSGSMGYAAFPRHGRDATSLLKAADMALYHAKSLGRDRLELFHRGLQAAAEQRSRVFLEIEAGLKRGEFQFFYQPIVHRMPGTPVGLEALMRWRHPDRGLLAPGDFAVAFDDPAMRATLGMFTLDRVFDDMKLLRDRGVPLGRVAINLTNSDFRSEQFMERFFARCDETGIRLDQICVEVTEDMFLGRDHKRVELGLHQFHAAGVEVALDDFGTGYASLRHLRELPIDRLKIDRRFVSHITTSHEDQAIVSGVIDIAHGLGKVVTAEGVETASQARMLLGMQCDFLQGWYFSKACDTTILPSVIRRLPEMRDVLRGWREA